VHLYSSQIFPQRYTHQRGTIPFRPARGLVNGLQQPFIENNPDCFHMPTYSSIYATHRFPAMRRLPSGSLQPRPLTVSTLANHL
jgi:hypothetical protein